MRAKHSAKSIPSGTLTFFFMSAALVYLELVFRAYFVACHDSPFFGAGFFITVAFSIAGGFLLTLLCSFCKPKTNFVIACFLLGFNTLIFMVQAVYHKSFNSIMKLSLAAENTGAVAEFATNTINAIFSMLWMILLLAVPMVVLIVFGRERKKQKHSRAHSQRWHMLFDKPVIKYQKYPGAAKVALLVIVLIIYGIPRIAIALTNGTTGLKATYSNAFEHNLAAESFGLRTTMRREIVLSVERKLGMVGDAVVLPENPNDGGEGEGGNGSEGSSGQEGEQKIVYGKNIMDIDFDSLIEKESDSTLISMHKYFRDRTPTSKNEYTGLFEGYNLITMTCEGWSPWAVSKELTPTLYMMQQDGFTFTNFYTSGYDDTITGEFVHTTGLIPGQAANNMKAIAGHWLPFCMGRQFQYLGIKTQAYHDHTYTYYGRDKSHPSLGYDVYKGKGNGLELEHPKWWPESDLEMIESTTKDYLGKGRFHAYYMTVSGHKDYGFSDNMMCWRNRDAVANLQYPEKVRAYIAANYELEKAMTRLLEILKENGQLENTVIVMTPDHKPQDITDKELEVVSGFELDPVFESYRSMFICYCAGYKDAPTIDAPCNAIDIIPTISNLMGFEYDSRLLFGRDVLDPDAEQIVPFASRSWITDKGRYNFKKKVFTPNEGVTFASEEEKEEYITRINNIVRNKFTMSDYVISKDYYKKLKIHMK